MNWLGLKASLLACVLLSTVAAQATTLTFSEHSTVPSLTASLLATLEFQVTGSVLQVEVTNQTLADPYDIRHIFFNASEDVEGLVLPGYLNNPYWSLYDGGYEVYNPLFGRFGYSLYSYAPSMREELIQPGETGVFVLEILCADGAVCDASDFVTALSGGRIPVVASMQFTSLLGYAPIGATSTVVPEPGTAALLGLGLAGLATGRRRRRP